MMNAQNKYEKIPGIHVLHESDFTLTAERLYQPSAFLAPVTSMGRRMRKTKVLTAVI